MEIRAEGLAELQSVLRKAPARLDKVIRAEMRAAATEVRTEARARARARGVPRHVQRTIRSGAGISNAWVSIGGADTPDALGWEFGANQDVTRSRRTGAYIGFRQFPTVAGQGPRAGWFFYPALRPAKEKLIGRLGDLLERLGEGG